MTTSIAMECKKLCFFRCLHAVGLSIGMQYLLLTIFLLFVNFNIFHPIDWITKTFGLIFSFYTWLCIMPLIIATIVYGILLGKINLSVKEYYASRFTWMCGTILRKIAFLGIHTTVGFLTAWFYSRFLHEDYRTLTVKCFDGYCVNSRYTFLMTAGVAAGFYYFVKENLRNDPEIEFPIIQQKKYVQIRSQIYSTLYTSLVKSCIPTICFSVLYWILGRFVNHKVARVFGAEVDDCLLSLLSIVTSFRLLFYVWILLSQILSHMQLMSRFFSIMLAQEISFVIDNSPVLKHDATEVTLVEALAQDKVPVIQKLASIDLYNLSLAKTSARRQEIFALSLPGGHPYNWNQLSGQCLSLINAFTEELASSVKNISTMKNTGLYTNFKPSATEAAEKILLRQYNESFNIRRMMDEQCPQQGDKSKANVRPNACARVSEAFEQFSRQLDESIRTAFRTIPGLFYMFGEQDGAKTAFLLSNCQAIVCLTQGIAGICASSLFEDKYGVVQGELPLVIKALLKLKQELDKLNNVNLNGKKSDRNLTVLKNAVKRSLFKICTVFGDYMRDLIDDVVDYRQLQCFVSYQET